MIEVGQQRQFTIYSGEGGASRRDPHTVVRINGLGEVLIKYADRTTEWHPIGMYQLETAPTDGRCYHSLKDSVP